MGRIIRDMKLDEFLTSRKLTDSAFGEMIGRSQSTISRIRRGETLPDWETVRRITEATNGAVMANDFVKKERSPVTGNAA